MTKRNYWLIAIGYLTTIASFFLYSFTQVDLNLTLSRQSDIQNFQKFFIQIGYFNRPLSTIIFSVVLFLLFAFYFLILWLVKRQKISPRQVWHLIILTTTILLFAYPAFSHDLFNYMFDARIFTTYGLNPYEYKALDFPADPWIRFMHWTHRTYPYGPLFLIISFIPSFLGLGKFILTFLNFKILTAGGFLGSAILVERITQRIDPEKRLFALSFFAFNPLIITEVLVSGHNDILMLFFLLLSLYFLVQEKKLLSSIFLLASAGIKFATVIFLPLYLFLLTKRKMNWDLFFKVLILLFLFSLLKIILEREPYPWYFITLFGLISLITKGLFFMAISIGLSLGLLLRYAPFLYFGNYQEPVPTLTFWLTAVPLFLSLSIWLRMRLRK